MLGKSVCVLLVAAWTWSAAGRAAAQEGKIDSGLQPGPAGKPVKMPKAFDVRTFNGKSADRFHCLVCENDIHPTLLLFLKEPAEGKEKALETLLAKLDEMVEKYQALEKYPDLQSFNVYAVFVTPKAQTSLDTVETDPAKLVKEATDRRALYARMKEWAGKVKKVVIGCVVPESVAAYKISPEAGVTAIYYDRLDVLGNYSYQELSEADVDALVMGVERKLAARIAEIEARKKTRK